MIVRVTGTKEKEGVALSPLPLCLLPPVALCSLRAHLCAKVLLSQDLGLLISCVTPLLHAADCRPCHLSHSPQCPQPEPHLCAKVLLSQDLGQLRLADTSRAHQQQRSTGAVGVLETHTSPAGGTASHNQVET
jgi:hypothetical protein